MQGTSNLAVIVCVYGALVLIGGVMGWAKAKSRPSLIAGLIGGLALLIAGGAISRGIAAGTYAALAIALLLAVVMGIRFAKTKKLMPAGLVTALSVVVALLVVVALAD